MSLVVLVSMVYSINKMSVLYMNKNMSNSAIVLPAQPPDRKVLSIHKSGLHPDDDIAANHVRHQFKRSAHVKPELVRLTTEQDEIEVSSETITKPIHKVPKKPSDQNQNDEKDHEYVAEDEINQARMLDELDGFNYFVEWEDQYKVKNAHLPLIGKTYFEQIEIARRMREHEPIDEMMLLQGAL